MVSHFADTKEQMSWKDYFYIASLLTALLARNIFGLLYWKNVTAISIKCRSMFHSIVIQKSIRIRFLESTVGV